MLGIFKNIFGRNEDQNPEGTVAKQRLQKLRDRKVSPQSEGEDAASSFRDLVQAKTHEPGTSPFSVWTGMEQKAHSVGLTKNGMVRPFKGGAFGFSENPMQDDIDTFNRENFAESSEKKKSQSDLRRATLANLLTRHGQIERNLDPEPGSSGQYDIVVQRELTTDSLRADGVVEDSVLASDWSANESLFGGTGLFCEYSDTVTMRAPEPPQVEERAKCFGPPVDLNKLEKPKETKREQIPLEEDFDFVDEVLFHYDNSESLFDECEEVLNEVEEVPVVQPLPEVVVKRAELIAITPENTVKPASPVKTSAAVKVSAPKAAPLAKPVAKEPEGIAKPQATAPVKAAQATPLPPSSAKPQIKATATPAAAPQAAPVAKASAAKAPVTKAPVTKEVPAAQTPPAQSKRKELTRIEDPTSSPRTTKEGKKNLLLSDLCDSMEVKQFSHPYDKFSESSLKLIAQNPKTPTGALAWLAAHRDPHIRAAVAKNPVTPIETFWVLARDHEASIRYSIAENLYMSPEILRELSRDRNPLIATTAQNALHSVRESLMNALPPSSLYGKRTGNTGQSMPAAKAAVPEPELQQGQQGDEEFLLMIARKTTTPARRLKELANHSHSAIRAAVAENANTPPDILWLMARDSDPTVKIRLSGNCNLPEEILDILKEDRDSFVAKAAVNMQNKLAGMRFTGEAGGNDIRHILTWP